jgi:hypothetical protein
VVDGSERSDSARAGCCRSVSDDRARVAASGSAVVVDGVVGSVDEGVVVVDGVVDRREVRCVVDCATAGKARAERRRAKTGIE